MNWLGVAQADVDAGHRIRDAINLHLIASKDVMENVGRWCAFKLEDGTSDGHCYGSKDEAIANQRPWEQRYFYMVITPDGITVADAIRMLRIHRNPLINVLAPEHVHNSQVFPRFSNLPRNARREIVRRERERLERYR